MSWSRLLKGVMWTALPPVLLAIMLWAYLYWHNHRPQNALAQCSVSHDWREPGETFTLNFNLLHSPDAVKSGSVESTRLALALVMDSSGSMQDWLAPISASVAEIAPQFALPMQRTRYAAVEFGGTDRSLLPDGGWTYDLIYLVAVTDLAHLGQAGGGTSGMALLNGLRNLFPAGQCDANEKRVVLLFSDLEISGSDELSDELHNLKQQCQVIFHAIAPTGYNRSVASALHDSLSISSLSDIGQLPQRLGLLLSQELESSQLHTGILKHVMDPRAFAVEGSQPENEPYARHWRAGERGELNQWIQPLWQAGTQRQLPLLGLHTGLWRLGEQASQLEYPYNQNVPPSQCPIQPAILIAPQWLLLIPWLPLLFWLLYALGELLRRKQAIEPLEPVRSNPLPLAPRSLRIGATARTSEWVKPNLIVVGQAERLDMASAESGMTLTQAPLRLSFDVSLESGASRSQLRRIKQAWRQITLPEKYHDLHPWLEPDYLAQVMGESAQTYWVQYRNSARDAQQLQGRGSHDRVLNWLAYTAWCENEPENELSQAIAAGVIRPLTSAVKKSAEPQKILLVLDSAQAFGSAIALRLAADIRRICANANYPCELIGLVLSDPNETRDRHSASVSAAFWDDLELALLRRRYPIPTNVHSADLQVPLGNLAVLDYVFEVVCGRRDNLEQILDSLAELVNDPQSERYFFNTLPTVQANQHVRLEVREFGVAHALIQRLLTLHLARRWLIALAQWHSAPPNAADFDAETVWAEWYIQKRQEHVIAMPLLAELISMLLPPPLGDLEPRAPAALVALQDVERFRSELRASSIAIINQCLGFGNTRMQVSLDQLAQLLCWMADTIEASERTARLSALSATQSSVLLEHALVLRQLADQIDRWYAQLHAAADQRQREIEHLSETYRNTLSTLVDPEESQIWLNHLAQELETLLAGPLSSSTVSAQSSCHSEIVRRFRLNIEDDQQDGLVVYFGFGVEEQRAHASPEALVTGVDHCSERLAQHLDTATLTHQFHQAWQRHEGLKQFTSYVSRARPYASIVRVPKNRIGEHDGDWMNELRRVLNHTGDHVEPLFLARADPARLSRVRWSIVTRDSNMSDAGELPYLDPANRATQRLQTHLQHQLDLQVPTFPPPLRLALAQRSVFERFAVLFAVNRIHTVKDVYGREQWQYAGSWLTHGQHNTLDHAAAEFVTQVHFATLPDELTETAPSSPVVLDSHWQERIQQWCQRGAPAEDEALTLAVVSVVLSEIKQ